MSSVRPPTMVLAGLALAAGLATLGAATSNHGATAQLPALADADPHRTQPASPVRPSALLIDFAAVSDNGTPVLDLQLAEVEVRLEGRPKTLRSLRRVEVGSPAFSSDVRSTGPAPYGTNDDVIPGRTIVFVVDEESFVAGREPLLRSAAEGLLSLAAPADRMMVLALPFGGIKTPFTSDRAQIRKAMEGVTVQGTRDETGSDLACRTRRFLESLDGFLQGEAGRSSPLTLVVFTGGLAAPRRDAPMALSPGMCELPITHFQRITAAAGAARANVYLLQPADIGMNAGGWNETIAGANHLGSDNPLEGIEHLAGATGAVRLPLDAAGTASLVRVATETAAYYVADLEPDPDEIVGRSRPVSVRVTRRGVTVRARPEVTFSNRPAHPAASRLAITSLLAAPDPLAGLPLRAAGFAVREASGQLRVGVVVEPAEPSVSLAAVGSVLLDADGRVVARWIAPDASVRPLLGAMAVAPGRYRLRVAAVDTDGRAGVAEDDVEARLTPAGPLTLGSILLGVSRDQAVVPRLLFGAEPTAIASFDIYGGAAGLPLTATLDLARTPDGPAMLGLPLTMTRADETRVVATGAVPVGALPPGDYVVRATITLGDGATGRIVRTLRKAAR